MTVDVTYRLDPDKPRDCSSQRTEHNLVREVRDHSLLPGWKQDRLLCADCGGVLYGWSKPYRPSPQSGDLDD